MNDESNIKLFVLANSLTENNLDTIERNHNIDLGRKEQEPIKEQDYYAQFDSVFRKEAREMSKHYEVFYCLEKSIRNLVVQLMFEKYGENWWEDKVKEDIKKNVKDNIQKEIESGFTERSQSDIDYTTFGELTEIVKNNWEAFSGLFRDVKAFSKIMSSLNQLRGPIAHCCPLAEDEAVRLNLVVKDWFRLME